VVKAEHEYLPEIQKYLEKVWKELYPTKPFESKFQDELVLGEGRNLNANLEKIFLFITLLGGLLSASGIFALASLNVAKRTKEIGIRKALGASVNNIVGLLNREFMIILIIAVILGSLGGYFLTGELLGQIYKYHIPVGIIPVILCSAVIFGIGIFTTSATILKAAKTNPVETLRSE
jgi:ABC-type antimicrobial peptide transport system permease subunit